MADKLAMLSPEEVAKIKSEIEALEKARQACADTGIEKQIDVWIEKLRRQIPSKPSE
jgi:hypothetical protein